MPIYSKAGKVVLFIHVPKTGGGSIEQLFRASGWAQEYFDGTSGRSSLNHQRRCSPQHMHAEMLNMLFRPWNFDAIFMMVREPMARFRSEFLWRRKYARETYGTDAESVQRWADAAFDLYRKNPWAYDNHLRPQSQFMMDGATVFKFEDGFEAIGTELRSGMGLDLKRTVPHLHGEKSGPSSQDVDIPEDLSRRLLDFYAADYELFGYDRPVAREFSGARTSG